MFKTKRIWIFFGISVPLILISMNFSAKKTKNHDNASSHKILETAWTSWFFISQ